MSVETSLGWEVEGGSLSRQFNLSDRASSRNCKNEFRTRWISQIVGRCPVTGKNADLVEQIHHASRTRVEDQPQLRGTFGPGEAPGGCCQPDERWVKAGISVVLCTTGPVNPCGHADVHYTIRPPVTVGIGPAGRKLAASKLTTLGRSQPDRLGYSFGNGLGRTRDGARTGAGTHCLIRACVPTSV
jgi:hypothetical protein